MVFSRFASPDLNQLFRRLVSVRGKVKVKQFIDADGGGTVCNVVSRVPQVFYRVDCGGPSEADEARFKYFVEKVCISYSYVTIDSRNDPINSENKNNSLYPIIL
jgi:U3 small nucleolar RNA-associated protein 25